MWRFAILGLLCGCAPDYSDKRCTVNAECPAGQRCFTVNKEVIPDGDCQPAMGARVCRPVCADCSQASACGCQCP